MALSLIASVNDVVTGTELCVRVTVPSQGAFRHARQRGLQA